MTKSDLEVVDPPSMGVNIEAAGRLRLDSDRVPIMRLRPLYDDAPFCSTTAYCPPEFGVLLLASTVLGTSGVKKNTTVLRVVQDVIGSPIAEADQTITATAADSEISTQLDLTEGEPTMRIDRLYSDASGMLIELAVNHFNPSRYTYRFQMKASA